MKIFPRLKTLLTRAHKHPPTLVPMLPAATEPIAVDLEITDHTCGFIFSESYVLFARGIDDPKFKADVVALVHSRDSCINVTPDSFTACEGWVDDQVQYRFYAAAGDAYWANIEPLLTSRSKHFEMWAQAHAADARLFVAKAIAGDHIRFEDIRDAIAPQIYAIYESQVLLVP